MPARKPFKRIISTEMQGDDSWVEIAPMKYGDAKRLVEMSTKAKAAAQNDEGDNLSLMASIEATINANVKGWNWVDDAGQPLAQPSELGVVDCLTTDELGWLIEQLSGSVTDGQKK